VKVNGSKIIFGMGVGFAVAMMFVALYFALD